MDPSNKKCTQCCEILSISNFYRDRTIINNIAYRSKCKSCFKLNQDKRVRRNIDTSIISKICLVCKIDKKIDQYYKSYRHLDGYFAECGKCLDKKRLNVGNNVKIKRTKEYMIQYQKKQNENVNYKLKYMLRSNMNRCIKLYNGVKCNRTLKYVGCTVEFLKTWFEFLFDENMTFDNHGKYWHIDHIQPCSSFDLSDQSMIYNCYNWKNLRPCTIQENLQKGDKIDRELIQKYEGLKDKFLQKTNYTEIYSSASCGERPHFSLLFKEKESGELLETPKAISTTT